MPSSSFYLPPVVEDTSMLVVGRRRSSSQRLQHPLFLDALHAPPLVLTDVSKMGMRLVHASWLGENLHAIISIMRTRWQPSSLKLKAAQPIYVYPGFFDTGCLKRWPQGRWKIRR